MHCHLLMLPDLSKYLLLTFITSLAFVIFLNQVSSLNQTRKTLHRRRKKSLTYLLPLVMLIVRIRLIVICYLQYSNLLSTDANFLSPRLFFCRLLLVFSENFLEEQELLLRWLHRHLLNTYNKQSVWFVNN